MHQEEWLKDHCSGHYFRVEAMHLNYPMLATCSEDHSIRIWNLEDNTLEAILKGHRRRINSVILTPCKNFLISCSIDKTIKVWNRHNYTEVFQLLGHDLSVNSIAITNDGNYIVSASGSVKNTDNTVRLWDFNTRKQIHVFEDHKFIVVKVFISGDKIVSINSSNMIMIHDINNRVLEGTFIEQFSKYFNVCLYKDLLFFEDTSNSIKVFSISKREIVRKIQLENKTTIFLTVDSANSMLVLLSLKGELFIYNANSCDLIMSTLLKFSVERPVFVYRHPFIYLSEDKYLYAVNIENLKESSFPGHNWFIDSKDYSSDRKKIITTSGDLTVRVWQTENLREIHSIKRENQPIGAWFMENNKFALIADRIGCIDTVDLENLTFVHRFSFSKNYCLNSCAYLNFDFIVCNLRAREFFMTKINPIVVFWHEPSNEIVFEINLKPKIKSFSLSRSLKYLLCQTTESDNSTIMTIKIPGNVKSLFRQKGC
ncbi:hypothetical protein SteCoe_32233 [Stentor coeruleus]|uniref:Anaphase-promoting complex subunit 4 WD40 domain-containing protein n=1 Tax=Stentor coeruleus TaxID=5963 RepID=A0A1R2AZI4_9CILI|nr:hypothetical protein SteCoe_32233 [Stentor coeruleus]